MYVYLWISGQTCTRSRLWFLFFYWCFQDFLKDVYFIVRKKSEDEYVFFKRWAVIMYGLIGIQLNKKIGNLTLFIGIWDNLPTNMGLFCVLQSITSLKEVLVAVMKVIDFMWNLFTHKTVVFCKQYVKPLLSVKDSWFSSGCI